MEQTMESKAVINKVSWRLIPFLVFAYLLCFIDRVNLGFAALTMNKDLGFTATVFGWGAGILFIGYLFFGVPSNLAMQKYGARRTIATIMIVWGLISASMAFVQGTVSFLVMRFLLGAAEAGFFPGVIFYLSSWFPAENRGAIVSRFMFAQPIASMLGSAVSGWLLTLDGMMGVAGWKWMFILEGIPSALVGVVAFLYLTDIPAKAAWLTAREREWLQSTLDAERQKVEAVRKYSIFEVMANPRVLLLGVIYISMVVGVYGVNMWLPQIVKGFGGLSNSQIGYVSAIPFVVAAIGMLAIGMSSDRLRERKWHMVGSMIIAGVGLIGSAFTTENPFITIMLIALSSIGYYGCMPIFWTIPPTFLAGASAAAGIAFINSIGNLGGFFGPIVVGWIKDTTGSFISGLIFLGASVLAGSILGYLVFNKMKKSEQAPALAYQEREA